VNGGRFITLIYLLVYLLDYPTIFGAPSDNYCASARHLGPYLSNINALPSISNKYYEDPLYIRSLLVTLSSIIYKFTYGLYTGLRY
jgi:hypothetical protein